MCKTAETLTLISPVQTPTRRFDLWLAEQLEGRLSRSRIRELMRQNAIRLAHNAPADPRRFPPPGTAIHIHIPPPRPAIPQPQALPLSIVFEDSDILVLDKPAGAVVHPAPGHADGTLVNALLYHCHDLGGVGGVARPGIVHRLDRETSGLLVVAKHDAAHAKLSAAFKHRKVDKTYLALAHGRPQRARGTIDAPIGRHPVNRKKMSVRDTQGRSAVSHFHVREDFERCIEIEVRIETGRTHQIRVHLAHIGCPILGDPLYGNHTRDQTLPLLPPRVMLHAWQLALPHPADGRQLAFCIEPPQDYAAMKAALETVFRCAPPEP